MRNSQGITRFLTTEYNELVLLIRLGKQVRIDDKKQRHDDKLKLLTLNVSPTILY